jgi:hypothetical protein
LPNVGFLSLGCPKNLVDSEVMMGILARHGYELTARADDASNSPESYRPATTPGVYVPTAIPIESTIFKMTPWAMSTSSQFRPAPPPALNSEVWTRDLNEIREVGSNTSTRRTAEQTTTARFWFFTGPRTYNPIVRQVALARKMDIEDCARLYALSSIAGVDAFIAVFDGKYTYNLWRPMTAIRNADLTSNPATPREASWLPLGTTPMHPEYPCAHCIVAAAVSTVLQKVAGDEAGEITLVSPTAPGVTRKWTRLQDYSDEVSNARIYAGFHYRFSTEVGKDMGRKIGERGRRNCWGRWPWRSRNRDRLRRSWIRLRVRSPDAIRGDRRSFFRLLLCRHKLQDRRAAVGAAG